MKKLLSVLVAICMCVPFAFAAVGCKNGSSNSNDKEDQPNSNGNQQGDVVTYDANSGLYQNGERVMTWAEIVEQFPNAIDGNVIEADLYSSYFSKLTGTIVIDSTITTIGSYAFADSTIEAIFLPQSIIRIEGFAFRNCRFLTKVYFLTISDLMAIYSKIDNVMNANDPLLNATRFIYSEEQPTSGGNYWHYNENGAPVEW